MTVSSATVLSPERPSGHIARCRNDNKVEAAGIEPASADAPVRASTSVVRALDSTAGRGRTPYRRPSHPSGVAPPAIGSPSVPSPFLAPLPEPRAQLGATSSPNRG